MDATPAVKIEENQKTAGGPAGESWLASVIKIFSSVRLAVFLLAAVAGLCALGTLVPQLKERAFYEARYGAGAAFIYLFSLEDIYHSFIFYFSVALLSFNIIVCSLRRLRARRASLLGGREFLSAPDMAGLKYNALVEGFDAASLESLMTGLKKAGYKVSTGDNAGILSCRAEKGRYFFAGEQLVHLSIIIIIAGAMIGNLYGYKTYLQLYPGDIAEIPAPDYQRQRAKLQRLTAAAGEKEGSALKKAASLMKEIAAIEERELFSLKINDFKTEYFESAPPRATDEGALYVKNWNTYYTIIDGGKELSGGVIAVNSPLGYKGVNIYQSSYFKTYDKLESVKIKVDYCTTNETEILEFNDIGAEKTAAGGKVKIKLASFVADFRFDPNSREIYSASEYPRNPALKFIISGPSSADSGSVWVFKNMPDFAGTLLKDLKYDFDLKIESLETAAREATGLQVNYDPGVGIVWAGCALLTLGLFMSFNIIHKRIWFSYDSALKKLAAGGSANKGAADFEAEFSSFFGCENKDKQEN
jgi:cytochrome c biogenesis protein